MHQRIGEILQEQELLTKKQVLSIVKNQNKTNALFGQLAVNLGFISENDLIKILSRLYNIEIVNLDFIYIDKITLSLLSYNEAARFQAIPFFCDENTIKIALADPGNLPAIDHFYEKFCDFRIEFYIAKESEISRFLEIMKCGLKEIENEPLLLLNKIIFEAIEQRASDIHFEPAEQNVRVRIRIDGILQILQSFDLDLWSRIKARLKLISNLDITENRRPQSGHTRVFLGGKTLDLRVSSHPGIFDENFVIRIFDLSDGVKSLFELGFADDDLLWLKNIISYPNGIFLIVGPTGSGKTTTLYSLLKEINSPSINIMTLEDPVEYQINGIKQLDLREEGILSFSDGVRSILRQDPDVLLIGEIRDEATATSAIRASLTGRLVLATLHAATPLEGIRRLLDLGLSLSDLIQSVVGIFSQRLVRRIENANYTGRFPITEYMSFSSDLKKELLFKQDLSICKNDKSFRQSSEQAIKNHLTDAQEIARVLGDADLFL